MMFVGVSIKSIWKKIKHFYFQTRAFFDQRQFFPIPGSQYIKYFILTFRTPDEIELKLRNNFWEKNGWSLFTFYDKITQTLTARLMSGSKIPRNLFFFCFIKRKYIFFQNNGFSFYSDRHTWKNIYEILQWIHHCCCAVGQIRKIKS